MPSQSDIEQLRSDLEMIKVVVSDLQSKVDDMYARPLMPYSSGVASGSVLTLGVDLRPYWGSL